MSTRERVRVMLEWFGRRQTIALPINSVVGCLIATILLMISSENNVRTQPPGSSGIIFPARIVGVLYVAGGNHALRLVEAGRLESGRDPVARTSRGPPTRLRASGFAPKTIFVAPEYNYGPSAVLKNALDWVYPEWNRKAAAFVSYGSAMALAASSSSA